MGRLLGDVNLDLYKDPIGLKSLTQGFATGTILQNQIAKANTDQEKADREKIEGAIKLHDNMKGMTYGNLDYYNKSYRPEMIKRGVPPGMLPEFQTVDDLNKGLYQNEMIKALYNQKMRGHSVVPTGASIYEPGEGFKQPEISPTQQAILDQKQAEEQGRMAREEQGLLGKEKHIRLEFGLRDQEMMKRHNLELEKIKEDGKQGSKGVPVLVKTKTDDFAWAMPGSQELVVIKGVEGKAQAGESQKAHNSAYKAAVDELEAGSIRKVGEDGKPNPAYDAEFKKSYQKYFDLYTQRMKQEQAPGAAPTSKPGFQRPGYYRDKSGNEVPIRSQEEYDRIFR